MDPSSDETALNVSITLENSIKRIIHSDANVEAVYPSSLEKAKNGLFGDLPDGLMCLSGGDVLVAAFGSGKVFSLARDGTRYSDPIEIVKGLGNPTDLTIARSSKGAGMSLYVTTKKGGIIAWRSVSQGKVVEVPDIQEKIRGAKSRARQAAF